MIDGRRILAVVPARGGSKGIHRKNLRPVGGVPLVGHAAACINQVPIIDRSVASTDEEDIAQVARTYGLDAPFLRPPLLSGDRVADQPVLEHALKAVEEIDGVVYDLILMVQPTSPLRTPRHLSDAIELLVQRQFDSLWTVSPTDPKFHPRKQLHVDGDLGLHYHSDKGAGVVARQELPTLYHRNGVAYVMSRSCLVEEQSIKGRRAGAMVIDDPGLINIDSPWDLELANIIWDLRSSSAT